MKNKAKRFLRLLLAIAMVMAIVPMTFALATETDNVAKIGDTGYNGEKIQVLEKLSGFTGAIEIANSDDYEAVKVDGVWTIQAKKKPVTEVTITIKDATMVEGNAMPQFTYTTNVDVPGLSITPTTTADGKTAGTYAITVTAPQMEDYTFTVVSGTLTVEKALVRVYAKNNASAKYFASLKEAIEFAVAQKGNVPVYLLSNIALDETIVINDTNAGLVELQGDKTGGQTFTLTSTHSGEMFKVEKGTLAVKNLKINSQGDTFYVTGGTLNLNYHSAGKQFLEITSQTGNCIYIRGGSVNVNGAKLTALGEYPAIQGNGAYVGNVTITKWNISDGTYPVISAPNSDMAIYWPGNGKLTIEGGQISGDTALYAKSGTIVINGGEFIGTGAKVDFAHNSNGAFATGDAVVIESCKDAAYETPVVSITGGTFTSANAEAVALYDCKGTDEVKNFITGGVYNSDVQKYCKEHYYSISNGEDTWTILDHIPVTVIVNNATMVEGNAVPNEFTYTTAPELDFQLDITYTVDTENKIINATVADVGDYKFTVVPGNLIVLEAVASTKINGATVYFASLQEAYDQAANNGRIDVLKDIVLTETLEMNRYRGPSIYMNGKNLSGDLDTLIHVNTQGSTVSFSSSAKVTNTGDVFFVESGNLNIYGKCTITSENSNCIYVRGGKTIVQKAIVVANGEYPAIQGNGNYTGNVTIQGGAISAPNAAMAIYWPQNGTLTITGGTITGKTALYAKSGNIVINGGEFVATGDKVAFKHNSNGAYGTGDAVVIESCRDVAYETPAVTITGGTFTSAKAEAVMLYACDTNADAKAIMELSGGIYSSKPNAKWCADGMGPKHYGDNQWTVGNGAISVDDVWFDSWDEAESSIKKNSTIVLHDDVVNYYGGTVAKDFKFPANGGNITLDLNGHSFTSAKSNTSAVTSVSVQYGTVLNIIGEGKFVIENNSYPFVINPKATVKMAESVTFIGTMQFNGNSSNSGNLYIDETALIGLNGVFKPEAATRIVMDGEGNWTLSLGSLIMTGDASLGENTLTINKNCQLDLCGNKLTAKKIVGHGNLIDSTDGTGSVTTTEQLWFDGHNNGGYLPLKDGTCYRLFSVVLDNRGVQTNSAYPNMIRAGFTVRFNKVEAYNLLIASVQNGAIKANATFSSGETDEAAFSKAQISSHLEKARDQLAADKVVTNAITGTLTLEDGSVSIFAELLSETNVVVASQTSTYTKK